MTVRTIVPAVAGILEQLELDLPRVVTHADIDNVRVATSSSTTTEQAIRDLTEAGWLLPLKTRGVWEFAPAARAGVIGSGDPHIELRATLARRPDMGVMLAAESAAWLLGLSLRPPTRHVLAAPPGLRMPPALSEYRLLRAIPRLQSEIHEGLPVMTVASLLIAMADRPSSYRDWPNVSEWIPDSVGRFTFTELRTELRGKPRASWMRACYMVAHSGATTIASRLEPLAPAAKGPFYLGPRRAAGRYDRRFDVIDSLLTEAKV